MNAARQIFLGRGGGGGWKNPYVTDGLVAMWDGEWNAGGGVHDASATTWKDLSGSDLDMTVDPAHGSWEAQALSCDGIGYAARRVYAQPEVAQLISALPTIEIVFYDYKDDAVVFGFTYQTDIGYINFYRYYYNWVGVTYRRAVARTYSVASFSCAKDLMTINGVNAGAIVQTATVGGGDNLAVDIVIGGSNISSSTGALRASYAGRVYCIRVYNRALTAEEVARNYAKDKARFNLP